jgi:hypothetical protein
MTNTNNYIILDKLKDNKKQIIFTGCGGMIAYYFGIAKFLQENYSMDNISFGGVSGGSIIATFLTLKLNIDEIFDIYSKEFCENIIKKETGALFNTLGCVKKNLKDLFLDKCNENTYKYINEKELFISVTSIYNTNIVISNWESNDDLIDCIIASCGMPLLGEKLFQNFREKYCLDGCFSNNYPILYPYLPYIFITPLKWRYIPLSWFYIDSNIDWYKELFLLGYNDAIKNRDDFDYYLDKL